MKKVFLLSLFLGFFAQAERASAFETQGVVFIGEGNLCPQDDFNQAQIQAQKNADKKCLYLLAIRRTEWQNTCLYSSNGHFTQISASAQFICVDPYGSN